MIFQRKESVLWTQHGWSAVYFQDPEVVTLTDVDSFDVEQKDKLRSRAERARRGGLFNDADEPNIDHHAEGVVGDEPYDTDEEA